MSLFEKSEVLTIEDFIMSNQSLFENSNVVILEATDENGQSTPITITKELPQEVYLDYYFTRLSGDLHRKLINVIDNSRVSCDIAIYYLTKASITDAIIHAHNRGVIVRIITDCERSTNKWEMAQLSRLSGIPIKISNHNGSMHLKTVISDATTITTGSYNYTKSASTSNDENLIVITDPKMGEFYTNEFNAMWESTNYIDY